MRQVGFCCHIAQEVEAQGGDTTRPGHRVHPLKETSRFAPTLSGFSRMSLRKGLFGSGSPLACVSSPVFVFGTPLSVLTLLHYSRPL